MYTHEVMDSSVRSVPPVPRPKKMQTAEVIASDEQEEDSPERTAPEAPESSRPGERKSLPVGLNFMEELSKKIGAKRASEIPAAPPQEEVPEESGQLLSPEKESEEPAVVECRVDEGSAPEPPPAAEPPPAKKAPPPPPQPKSTTPPPVAKREAAPPLPQPKSRPPLLPPRKNSSESLATSSASNSLPSVPLVVAPVSDGRPYPAVDLVSEVSTPRSQSTIVESARVSEKRGSKIDASSSRPSLSQAGQNLLDDDLPLTSASAAPTLKAASRRSVVRQASSNDQIYSTWDQKNLATEVQRLSADLDDATTKNLRLEEQVRMLQRENARLQQRLDIQNDGDEMLREIRNRGRGSSDAESVNIPLFREEPTRRPGLCGSVCALFGRT